MSGVDRAREVHRRSKQIFLLVSRLDPEDRLAAGQLLARGDAEVEREVKSLLRVSEKRLRADPTR